MLNKRQTTGRVLSVSKIRRRQKRKPRKLLEATPQDWAKWERAAKLEGLNWSEFARRALEQRSSSVAELEQFAGERPELRAAMRERLPGLSEKPASKNGADAASKKRAAGARGKGSSRS
jgi:hypothetical protein